MKYIDKLWEAAKALSAGQPQQLLNLRRAELSWRIWKSENFRGEFWPLNLRESRMQCNAALFYDILELMDQQSEGGLYVSREDFDNLSLKLLWPRMWTWRQLGRDNEGKVNNLLELLLAGIL